METSVAENLSTRRSKRNGSTQKLETKEITTPDKHLSNSHGNVISTPTRRISLRADNPAAFQQQKHRRASNDTNTHGKQVEPNRYSRNARRRSTFQEADLHAIMQRHRRASHTRRRSCRKETAPQVKMCDRTPLEVFQKAVRMVIILTRAFRSIVRFAVEKGRHGEITDETTLSLKSTAGVRGVAEKLLFDPEAYKCQYQVMLPQWAKRLTSKEPSRRRDNEIRVLVRLMKQLKGFRRYSSEMQYAICRAIRYDCFSRRRVVIRKGHVAQRFYFIFSGSVCVTFDEDDYAAFNQPEDSDKSVLKKGDHFGELAFIRNLSRAATIVCLEKTELLSVDKEDFFNSGIDKSFKRGMEDRVEFLCSRPMFSSWPEEIVRKIAQESKLQDYCSDEVIVRDSTTSAWLVFIVKGHADVLRLLDLSNCEEYAQHCHKYRRGAIEGKTERCISPSNRISPSSIISFGLPFSCETDNSDETLELIPPIASETHVQLKQRGAKADVNRHSRTRSAAPALAQKTKAVTKLKAVTKFLNNGKRRKGHVTFENQYIRGTSGSVDARRVPIEAIPEDSETELGQMLDSGTPERHLEKAKTEEVGVGVYMRLDRLGPGDCFGVWSLSDSENKKKKDRRFHLLSLGCEVVKVSKESFHKHSDETTMEKLKDFLKVYPSDATLCRTYLKQSDWKTYREELVDNLVVNHLAKLETAKGSARANLVRASPVPPPLCSVKPWQQVNDKWEFFPNAGWAIGQVIKPAVEAGKSSRATRSKTWSLGQDLSRRSSQVSSRTTSCRTSLNSTPELTTQPGAQTSRHTPPPIIPSTSSGSLTPISTKPSMRRTRTPESVRVLPVVRNEEVLAKGSHRHLVLTQGGSRVNDRQIEVERKLLRYGGSRHFNLYSSKVS